MRTSIAMWSTGFVVGLAVLSMKPSEPWRDLSAAAVSAALLPDAASTDEAAPFRAHPPSAEEATADRASPPAPSDRMTSARTAGHERASTSARPLDTVPEPQPGRDDALPAPTDDRLHRLIAAGFEREHAAGILRREAELRHTAYYAEYEATGTVRPFGTTAQLETDQQLRAELGDDEYERYLDALGRPTRVVVGMVDADSPAAHGGILPDDEIIAYAGRRVFNGRELNAMMLEGSSGEIVPATIVRDGHTMEFYVTRGPLGIVQRP